MMFENICINCMKDKGDNLICPFCGYEDEILYKSALRPRTILNNQYLIRKVLGAGGFGITYLAWDLNLELSVAIKEFFPRTLVRRDRDKKNIILRSDSEKDTLKFENGLKRFLLEARTIAKFKNHPSIVRIITFFRENNTAYFVMDYYEGLSLSKYLESFGGKIDEKSAIKIILPILDGLSKVHNENYIHGDIKPSNIYLTKEMQSILLDFGAARLFFEEPENFKAVLTPGYAPPEQYNPKGENFSNCTDVYATGATLYKIITSKTPPEANPKKRLAHPESFFDDLKSENVSDSLIAILAKAMEFDTEKRIQTVEEFYKLLEQFILKQEENKALEIVKPSDNLAIAKITEEITENLPTIQITEQTKELEYPRWWKDLDSEFKEIFKQAINIKNEPSLDELEQIQNLKKIDCSDSKIKSLITLQNLISLEELDCHGTDIKNLFSVNYLKNLRELNCGKTQIESLSMIFDLVNLEVLFCNDTNLKTLEPLKNLYNLQKLDCGNTHIKTLEPIKNLSNLNALACWKTEIRSLEPIRNLTNLQVLRCDKTEIRSLEYLVYLNNLQYLSCSQTEIRSLEHISKMTNLQELDCSQTEIRSLEPIRDLQNIKYLNCGKTQVSQYEINQFIKEHPDCFVL